MLFQSHIAINPAPIPRWRIASGGTGLAVDLNAIKIFTNRPVEDDFWDAELTSFAKVAQSQIEQACQVNLTPTTYVGTLHQFYDRMALRRPRPFVDVTKVEYVAKGTGEITTLPADTYIVSPGLQDCGLIELGDGLSWPETARRMDAVRIEVKSGYAVTENDIDNGYPPLPEDIKHAVLMTIAALEMARGDTQGSAGANVTVYAMKQSRGGGIIPAEAMALLSPYRLVTVGVSG